MIIATSFDLSNQEMLNNRGLQFGDGLFETMRMSGGSIPLFDVHMKRLNKGLGVLKLDNIDEVILRQHILRNCPPEYTNASVIKLMVFRAAQQRGYQPRTSRIEWVITVDELATVAQPESVKLSVASQKIATMPMLAGLKHMARLEQVLLSAELAAHEGIDDLLVLNTKNHVIETTCQNVIIFKGDQILTPKLKQCGVRGVALKWLKSHFKVKSKSIKVKSLGQADGMMVCNAIRGFSPVSQIQSSQLKDQISFGTSLPIQDKITQQWEALFYT